MRLSQVARPVTTIHLQVGDEKLRLDYRPAAFTPQLEDELAELTDGQAGKTGRRFCNLLATVIAGWDLEEDDGSPVLVTGDRLLGLPGQFLADCLKAIAEDMNPGEARGRSVDGSRPTDGSAPNPTGIGSSAPPATSASLPGISPESP